MPRNSSGVYTLPQPPVVTGTPISSTVENSTDSDIGSELTNSLDRSGRGGMTGALKVIDGSAPLPGLSFGLDTDTGFYRIGANSIGAAVGGALALTIATTGIVVAGILSLSTAVGQIVPGATSISLRNAANSADNLLIADSGAITVRGSIGGVTTLTATASLLAPAVVTSIVDSGSGTLVLKGAGTPALTITGANAVFAGTLASGALTATGNSTITGTLGGVTTLSASTSVITPIVDSGTTGSLSLRTNNGTTEASILHVASAVNWLGLFGNATGSGPGITVDFNSSDSNLGMQFITKGTGAYTFQTGATAQFSGVAPQFQVLHTAGAIHNITVTGSPTNPTIGVTGGSLAITPNVVIGGGIIAGNGISLGTNPQFAFNGVNLSYGDAVISNSSGGGTPIGVIGLQTVNSVVQVTCVGGNIQNNSSGVILRTRSGAGAPTTADLPTSDWMLWRDTSGATTKLYYNNAGTLQSVALA